MEDIDDAINLSGCNVKNHDSCSDELMLNADDITPTFIPDFARIFGQDYNYRTVGHSIDKIIEFKNTSNGLMTNHQFNLNRKDDGMALCS